MIIAERLGKVFEEGSRRAFEAVKGVTFSCYPGEIYGLLGVNGAGKTTTLRVLATLLRPTSGTARIAGWDLGRSPDEVRARIGFLSTATALYGRLTARELVVYFGRLHGLTDAEVNDRTDRLFEELGISDLAGWRCDRLSTGMKQKVSIARTLIHDPPVMILDEPTLGLDVLAARTIVNFIRDCRTRGKTVLFSSHIMHEVGRLCDRIGVIHQGRLVAEGTVDALRRAWGEEDMEGVFIRAIEGR